MWPWKSRTERMLEMVLANQEAMVRNQYLLLQKVDASIKNQKQIVGRINGRMDEMEALLFDLLLCGKPGPVKIVVTGETEMADVLEFKVVLPSRSAPDVVSRELSVKIGDEDAQVHPVTVDQTEVTGLKGAENAAVTVSLVDIDNAGNRSEASEATATLVDDIAPPQPGALGLVITGETHVEDPAPEPGPQSPEEPGPQSPGEPGPQA